MNKAFLALLYVYLIVYSCSPSANSNNIPDQLIGKWIMVVESGGIAGDINDINTKTDRIILEINEKESVSYFYNDSLVSSSKFHIEKRKSIYSAELMDFIVYENNKEPEVITHLSKDTLSIADNHYDGFSRVYIKQKVIL